MKNLLPLLLLLLVCQSYGQVNTQIRFNSDSRKYYLWNEEKSEYSFVEEEFEHSIIDIREKGSKTNGYITISMVDNGQARLFHGSIVNFSVNENKESVWILQSKNLKSKLTVNSENKTVTYTYDSNEENSRYLRIFIFSVQAPLGN